MPERKAVDFSPHHTKKGGSPSIQKTLDQFETTKPLVRKLGSLKERREPPKRKRTPLEETRYQAEPKTWKLQTKAPIIISSNSNTSSPAAKHRLLHSSSSSEDILNTPSIEAKRRRLLEKDDWMGLNRPAMKPVKMKFADPADTDLIGKRRRISKTSYRHPLDRSRPIMREAIPVKRPHETLKAREQYYPEGDISVRIGSAVDRSDGRASLKDNTRLSVLSDELLDGVLPQLAHEPQPSVPVFNTPGPAPIRLSGHGYREVLTPSAYMTDSSSASRASDRVDHLRRHRQASSPVRMAEKFTSNGIDELREWALPSTEQEQAQEDPSFRLIFRDAPRPCAQRVKGRRSSPNVPEFAFTEVRTPKHSLELPAASPAFKRVPWNKIEIRNVRNPQHAERDIDKANTGLRAERLADVVPQPVLAAPENLEATHVDNHQIHSDPNVETLCITTPPSAMASAQILTEFQNCVASNARLEDGITRTLQDMEKRFARETCKALPPTSPRKAPQLIDRLGQLPHDHSQATSEVMGSIRDLTIPGPKGKTSLLQPPLQASSGTRVLQRPAKSSVTSNDESQISISATKDKKEALKAAEDEEAAWRKLVFGDDQDSNDHTFEEPEVPSQTSSSPNRPHLTQPSLLAEAATSPLMQNPHLADSTFNTSSSSDAFCSPIHNYTEDSPTRDFTSSPQPPPPPISTGPPTPAQPSLPRTLSHNPITSSLQAEASSPTHQNPSHGTLSSDELQRPPERLPQFPGTSGKQSQNQASRRLGSNQEQRASDHQTHRQGRNLQEAKIVFKKPTRYVGTYSSDPVPPVVLGDRVLRSGRRVGDVERKGANETREAKGKSGLEERDVLHEHEQYFMGDDDDIVDI